MPIQPIFGVGSNALMTAPGTGAVTLNRGHTPPQSTAAAGAQDDGRCPQVGRDRPPIGYSCGFRLNAKSATSVLSRKYRLRLNPELDFWESDADGTADQANVR
jgi:hypothetical protein